MAQHLILINVIFRKKLLYVFMTIDQIIEVPELIICFEKLKSSQVESARK